MKLTRTLIPIIAISSAFAVSNPLYDNEALASDIARVNGGDANIPAMDVVDISSNNGYLSVNDFRIMKNNGVRGIIVKLTEGNYYRNPYARSQISNASQAGLSVSGYHYSTYTDWNSARDEANCFANYAYELGLNNQALMMNDLEDQSTKTWNVSNKSWAFNDQLNQRGFHNTGLYTYLSYRNSNNLDTSFLPNSHIWMAQYPYNPSKYDLWNRQYGMWQWSSNAGFWGINGTFDVSIDYAGLASTRNLKLEFRDNNWYLIDQSTGEKQFGQQNYNNKWYYFDDKTGAMKHGLLYLYGQDKWVYYDNWDGSMQYGLHFIDNKWYLFESNTGKMLKGQQYYQGKWYLFDSYYGNMQYGLQYLKDAKKWVYYDKYYGNMKYGFQEVDGHKYFFDTQSGARRTGEVYYDNKWYLLDDKTGELKTGLQYLENNKKWVYYNKETGAMVHGRQTIEGHDYFFDKQSGARLTGQQYIDGKWYLLDDKTGEIKTGWQTLPQGKVYYDSTGAIVNGRQYIENHWYLFDRYNGSLKYGQQFDQGHWYLFDNTTGWMQYGMQYLSADKKWVYYDETSGWMQFGTKEIKGKKFVFDQRTGQRAEPGEQFVNGHWYFINDDNSVYTGWKSLAQGKVYYGLDGAMKFGEQFIDGSWYYLNNRTGAISYGQQYLYSSNKWVLYNRTTGAMMYGIQYDQGNWYYFDHQTGAMAYGKTYLPEIGKWVYYDAWSGVLKFIY